MLWWSVYNWESNAYQGVGMRLGLLEKTWKEQEIHLDDVSGLMASLRSTHLRDDCYCNWLIVVTGYFLVLSSFESMHWSLQCGQQGLHTAGQGDWSLTESTVLKFSDMCLDMAWLSSCLTLQDQVFKRRFRCMPLQAIRGRLYTHIFESQSSANRFQVKLLFPRVKERHWLFMWEGHELNILICSSSKSEHAYKNLNQAERNATLNIILQFTGLSATFLQPRRTFRLIIYII